MLFLRLSPLQLSPPSSTSAYSTPQLLTRLSSAHAWGPQPAGLTWSFSLPGASRQTCLAAASWYGRPGPPDLALLDLPRAGRAVRAPFHGKRHLHAAQWTQPSLGSTGEPPVIDLLKSWPPLAGHIFATFARAVPLIQPRSSMASVSAVSTASASSFCSADSGSCPCF